MTEPGGARLSRRSLLLLAGAGVALAACSSDRPGPASPSPSPATPRSPETAPVEQRSSTIALLLAETPFVVAHRGSGDDWTEHTALAYQQALLAGSMALEISVSRTADGVLVCHHDKNLKRLTGVDLDISAATWSQVQELRNDARQWLGPASDLQPIPRLDDVLTSIAADTTVFIEDKQGTNTSALLDLMDAQPRSRDRFVWKQWAGAAQVSSARDRGYTTWGYFGPELFDRLDELAPKFDLLGIPTTTDDDTVRRMVALGRPVIAWEVHRRSEAERLTALGVAGLMSSNLPYVASATATARADTFASGLRAAGDLPWTTEKGWSSQPVIDPASASLRFEQPEHISYVLGSLGPADHAISGVTLQVRWPEGANGPASISVAFSAGGDSPVRRGAATPDDLLLLSLTADGELALSERAAGQNEARPISSTSTDRPDAGEWCTLVLAKTSTGFSAHRKGSGEKLSTRTERAFGYVTLCRDDPAGPPVEFRRISMS